MVANFEGYLANGYRGKWLSYPIGASSIAEVANQENVDDSELSVSYIKVNDREYRLAKGFNGVSISEFNEAGEMLQLVPDVFVKHLSEFLEKCIFYDVAEFIKSWSEYHYFYPDLTSYWDIGNNCVLMRLKDSVISKFVDREALGREIANGLMTEDGYFSAIPIDKIY